MTNETNPTAVLPNLKRWLGNDIEVKSLVLLQAMPEMQKQRIEGDVVIDNKEAGKISLDILPAPESLSGLKVMSTNPITAWRFQYWFTDISGRKTLVACSNKDTAHMVEGQTAVLFVFDWLHRVYLCFLKNNDIEKYRKAKKDIETFYPTVSPEEILPSVTKQDSDFDNFNGDNQWTFVANLVNRQ